MKLKCFRKNAGFSLVELLIYMGILGAVSGILVGVLTTVTKTQVEESTLNDVSGQLAFVTQTIQRLVRDSSLIELDAGVATSTLKLRMPELANDPTYIYLSSGQIYVKVTDAGSAQTITSDKVTVDSLQFKKLSQPPGKDTVQIDISMSAVQPAAGKTISRALRTAVARVSAATFDSNLLPNADNSLDIGATTPRWKSGYFSQGVIMATVSGNVGIGTTNPQGKLSLQITHSTGVTSDLILGQTGSTPVSGIYSYTEDAGTGATALLFKTFKANVGLGERVRIDNAGNVGIGTIAPLSTLSINGGLHVGGDSDAGDNNILVDGTIKGRYSPRIYTTASTATLTPEINTYDYFEITAQAAALNIANPSTSVPTGGEKMIIAITSDASARALTYGTAYVAKAGVALPSTTVASKTTTLGFIYNAGLAKWNLVAAGQE